MDEFHFGETSNLFLCVFYVWLWSCYEERYKIWSLLITSEKILYSRNWSVKFCHNHFINSMLSFGSHCIRNMPYPVGVMVSQLQLVMCLQSFIGNMTMMIEVNPDQLN